MQVNILVCIMVYVQPLWTLLIRHGYMIKATFIFKKIFTFYHTTLGGLLHFPFYCEVYTINAYN
jgi:hypothetical protein